MCESVTLAKPANGKAAALCSCGRPLGHSGKHSGSEAAKRGGGWHIGAFAARLTRERAALADRRDALQASIREGQAELLSIDAKLEASKVMAAAYAPAAKPALAASPPIPPPPAPVPPPTGIRTPALPLARPFRIGERG